MDLHDLADAYLDVHDDRRADLARLLATRYDALAEHALDGYANVRRVANGSAERRRLLGLIEGSAQRQK